MKQLIPRHLAVLLLCITAQPLLAAPASHIEASYDVIGFGMTLANISETFNRKDDSYHIESVTRAVGLLARIKPETIRVTSQGKITPQGMLPLSYALTREIDTQKNASAKFNWETSILTHNDYKGVQDMPLPKGTQDRLSVLYHLPLQVQPGEAEFKFNMTDGNNLEDYNFSLTAETQRVRVPLGTFTTRYISNTPIGETVKYEIWMATELNNFPIKIIVTDAKGGKLTQVLTQVTITP
ncbi:MAG TPA: DUF3108 domain-containing protein [Gallionellaceae bacterium]|nr:DUF3108 domain-containing protein [Gallionellaceae bacterium]